MFSKSLILLLAAFSSVNALATPHLRSAHHHRAIAARVAAPTPQIDLPVLTLKKRDLRRRSLSRRCKTRPAPSSSIVSSSSSAVSSSVAPINVASAPPTFPTSSTHAQESSSTPQETSTKQATTFTPTTTATPTSTFTPTTSTSEAAATTSSSSSSNGFLTGTQSGQGTFYETGLGACGITNTDSDYIAAVSHILFDEYPGYDGVNPNDNPVCGKKVTAQYQGKSVTVTITDRCTGCQETDLDFSPAAFTQLADESLGRIDITWSWSS